MGLERRGCVVRPWPLANWKREEPVDEAKPFKQRPDIGSRVTREGHARFWERPEVKFLRATRQTERDRPDAAPRVNLQQRKCLQTGRHSRSVPQLHQGLCVRRPLLLMEPSQIRFTDLRLISRHRRPVEWVRALLVRLWAEAQDRRDTEVYGASALLG